MRQRLQRRSLGCGMVFGLVLAALSIDVTGQAGKRPLTYDVYDAWKTIQGTTVSRDGQWLAYAVDGAGRRRRADRPQPAVGSGISASRADEPGDHARREVRRLHDRAVEGRRGAAARAGTPRRRARPGARRREPGRSGAHTGAHVGGHHDARDRSGDDGRARRQSVQLPEESSTWVALYRGTGGGGARRRARRPRRGAGRRPAGTAAGDTGGEHAAATAPADRRRRSSGTARPGRRSRRTAGARSRAKAASSARSRRKESGSDLILRNLVSGQDITMPLVSDFEWTRDGSWIAYGVSSPKAEEDGAFARQMSDGAVRTLLKGKGNYKGFGFDEDGRQLAFLSDQADYDKDVAPYRLYYWKTADATATELVAATTRGMPAGHGGQRPGHAVVLEGRPASVSRHRAAARPPRRPTARRNRAAWICGTGRIRCCSRCSACAPSRSAIARIARSSISPTSGSCSSPRPRCRR